VLVAVRTPDNTISTIRATIHLIGGDVCRLSHKAFSRPWTTHCASVVSSGGVQSRLIQCLPRWTRRIGLTDEQ